MSSESLPQVQPQESPEQQSSTHEMEDGFEALDILRERLRVMSDEVNAELVAEGIKPILDERGRIMFQAYKKERGYYEEEVKDDEMYVADRESKFLFMQRRRGNSLDNDERYLAIYDYYTQHESDLSHDEKKARIEEDLRAEKDSGFGEMWEMYAATLFHRMFGKEYFIMRSSRFDDIARGVDMLIVHKETVDVVCAIDDVGVRKGSLAIEEKRRRTEEANRKGGKSVKYGIVKKDNQFFLGKNNYVPVLYADITFDTFQDMLSHMTSEGVSDDKVERALCERILGGMEKQFNEIERVVTEEEARRMADGSLPEYEKPSSDGAPVRKNILIAKERISDMRRMLADYQTSTE